MFNRRSFLSLLSLSPFAPKVQELNSPTLVVPRMYYFRMEGTVWAEFDDGFSGGTPIRLPEARGPKTPLQKALEVAHKKVLDNQREV